MSAANERRAILTQHDRVRNYLLTEGAAKCIEIATVLGIETRTATVAIAALRRYGHVVRAGGCGGRFGYVWQLTSRGRLLAKQSITSNIRH